MTQGSTIFGFILQKTPLTSVTVPVKKRTGSTSSRKKKFATQRQSSFDQLVTVHEEEADDAANLTTDPPTTPTPPTPKLADFAYEVVTAAAGNQVRKICTYTYMTL